MTEHSSACIDISRRARRVQRRLKCAHVQNARDALKGHAQRRRQRRPNKAKRLAKQFHQLIASTTANKRALTAKLAKGAKPLIDPPRHWADHDQAALNFCMAAVLQSPPDDTQQSRQALLQQCQAKIERQFSDLNKTQ